jgi:ribosomal protein S4
MLKYFYFKKYQDEVWGHLINRRKYNTVKKVILFKYKNFLLKRRPRIKTQYNYFRKINFLKKLRATLFNSRYSIRGIFLKNFVLKKKNSKLNWPKKKAVRFSFAASLIKKKFILTKPYFRVRLGLRCTMFKTVAIKWSSLFFFWTHNRIQYLLKKKIKMKTYKVFFYKTYMVIPQVKKKKASLFGSHTQYYKKLSLFYGFDNPKRFFAVYQRFLTSAKNNFFSLFSLLEGRLQILLFRLNLIPNIYFAKQFILRKNVYLNNKIKTSLHYVPKYNEIISFKKKYFKLIYYNLYRLLRKKSIFLNFPDYYDADYKLLTAVLIKPPKLKDLSLPFSSSGKYLKNLFSYSRL